MVNQSDGPAPVATWARVLAWLLVAARSFVIIGGTLAVLRGMPLPSIQWYEAVAFVLAAVWGVPLFWIVALTGRPPRYWFGLGSHLWRSETK